VAAARAASLLVSEGASAALLVVGTCGGLRRGLRPGTLVHCTVAAQTDLAVRDGREVSSDDGLREAWGAVAPGEQGWFLTADRPVFNPWRRLRLARAYAGPCVCDMETAAAAWVANRSGVPWAALRAVTDPAGPGGALRFRQNYPAQAPRAADTVVPLLARLDPASAMVRCQSPQPS
jgi:nucleoside phosphorylase